MKVVHSQKQPDVLLRAATFNAWHGLDGIGVLRFGELETRAERLQRLAKQIQTLKSLDADLIGLQEVNPLPFRAYWYAKELNKKVYFATANAGIKVGLGIPSNLNEGLAILCPKNWESHYVGTKHLNAKFNLLPLRLSFVKNMFLSLQASENRIALAVRVVVPAARRLKSFQGSQSVLVVCTHLYHGAGLSSASQRMLDEAKTNNDITQQEYCELLEVFRKSDAVREAQLAELMAWVGTQQRPGEPVLLMGDFNTEPSSTAIESLTAKGWSDAWGFAKSGSESETWNPLQNQFAGRTQKSIKVDERRAQHKAKIINQIDLSPKRIDYIFSKAWDASQNDVVGCFGQHLNTRRFGMGNESDHFGVVCDFGSPQSF